MGDATREDILVLLTCPLVVFALLTWGGWIGLHNLWQTHFHGKPVSRLYQLIKLLGWLLLAILVSACSVLMAWFLAATLGWIFVAFVS
jgi:hypothetical protein